MRSRAGHLARPLDSSGGRLLLRIREPRLQRGMTLVELADAAGISAGELSRIERGQRALPFPVAGRIAAVLGVRPSELLARPDD